MDPVIAAVLRGALALLFLAAAGHKLRDLRAFCAALAAYRLLPARATAPAAVVLVAAELGAGAALAAAVPAGALLGAALLLLYAAAITANLARGRREIDCGCAGPGLRQPLSAWLVGRNGVLAAAALGALVPVEARALVGVDAITIGGGIAALAVLWTALDRLLAAAPRLAALRGTA